MMRFPTLTEALAVAEHFQSEPEVIATNGHDGEVQFMLHGVADAPDVLKIAFVTFGFDQDSLTVAPDVVEGSSLPAFQVTIKTKRE